MRYLVLFVFLNIYQDFFFKERIVGDTEGYNLKVIVKIDESKKTEEINFKHIINHCCPIKVNKKRSHKMASQLKS